MTDFSDFMESRILEATLGQGSWQLPFTIEVDTVDDQALYSVIVTVLNTTNTYSYQAVVGDGAPEILTGLGAALTAEPALTITTTPQRDVHCSINAPWPSVALSVQASGTGVLTLSQKVYVALFTGSPAEDGSGTAFEVTDSGYTRTGASWDPVVSGSSTTSVDITFGPSQDATGFGTITHLALYDKISGGNLLLWALLTTPKTVLQNDTITFLASAITTTIS